MVGTMYAGYVFFCNNESEEQCLRQKKYACIKGSTDAAGSIPEGSTIFLYNGDKQTLLGPFTASEGGMIWEKGAWAEDIDEHSASANVKVGWEELHLLQNAPKQLPFLNDPKTCSLSETQTQRTLDTLKQSPLYVNNHPKK
jgi:hypothetical protein